MVLVLVISLVSSLVTMCSRAEKSSQGVSYTPIQLKEMIWSGKFPLQGTPKVEEKEMDFSVCVSAIETMISSVDPYYPTEVILDLPTARIQKFWTNNGSVMIACSALDAKYVITTAPYVKRL